MRRWRLAISAAILLPWLTSCGVAISSCPPIVAYSLEEQARAADELDAAAARGDVMLPRMIGDYAVLRDQVRACR